MFSLSFDFNFNFFSSLLGYVWSVYKLIIINEISEIILTRTIRFWRSGL